MSDSKLAKVMKEWLREADLHIAAAKEIREDSSTSGEREFDLHMESARIFLKCATELDALEKIAAMGDRPEWHEPASIAADALHRITKDN